MRGFSKLQVCLIILLLLVPTAALCEVRVANNLTSILKNESASADRVELTGLKGWDYLANKLVDDGLSPTVVSKVYSDPRMPPFDVVYFSLAPKESYGMYKDFNSKSQLQLARQFLINNKRLLDEAEKKYKVNRYVIASILLIETRYGKNTGKEMVLNRLSRVGSIAKPENILANYRKLSGEDPKVTFESVKARAEYLEDKFYPEIISLFELAKRNKLHPLSIRGSIAGAFGIPQFLPSSYLRFGVDGNRDGRVSLFTLHDAILSTANFLSSHGWSEKHDKENKGSVIWNYNQSDAYVDTVLLLAEKLSSR
ncbi:MAG: lytic murein transglycosylase [Deltaproteobacteria bacterium]|nr:lytic murein transglycosylase [Deltaproteobacteria bacterium]